MKKIWNTISYLGLKDHSQSISQRDIVLVNRLNFLIFILAALMSIVTTVIREINQGEFTFHTQKIFLLMLFCVINYFLSAKGLFALAKINLVFSPLFVIILLPVLLGVVHQMDFIYGPILIISLSLIPHLVLDHKRERKIYFATLLFFLIVVVVYDNLLVFFSNEQLPITGITHNFHEYYKAVFISAFLFVQAALFYLHALAFKFECELKSVNLILEQQRDEIADKNEELEQQHEEILTQSHELETINRHLEERVITELSKNRKKDVMLIQQSRQAAMGEMIGNIAHQWRQPLSAVAVIIQNIQEAYNYNELNREYLESKVKQCMELTDYMSQTIDDFRNFFKPEKSPAMFNVREVVNKCISFVKGTLNSSNIDYEFHSSEDIFINGFSNEYSQVVLNLISNAKDILVERKVKNPRIEITLFRKDEKSYLYVADNGGGIAPDIRDKIFTPYFTTKEQAMGTGIGLYMSKTIIEKNMGGSLTFVDIEGGTEFCVIL